MNVPCRIVFLSLLVIQARGLRLLSAQRQESECTPAQGRWRSAPASDSELPQYMQYEWVPTGGCELTKMNLDRFCKFMDKSKLTHLFFVGDSLSFMMAESFWRQMGEQTFSQFDFAKTPSDGSLELTRSDTTEAESVGFEQKLSCPTNTITFEYHRNDKLSETRKREKCGDKVIGTTFCYPWWDSYLQNADKTLLVANTGLHHHHPESFRTSFDSFFSRISQANTGPVIFRLSVPGHPNCQKYTQPLQNENEFELSNEFRWDLVPSFNTYARSKFQESQNPNFKILDVYNMSILRPDGHLHADDCLHYKVPGVPDWWNNLLMTELQ